MGGSGVVSDTERIFNDLIDGTTSTILHSNCWFLKKIDRDLKSSPGQWPESEAAAEADKSVMEPWFCRTRKAAVESPYSRNDRSAESKSPASACNSRPLTSSMFEEPRSDLRFIVHQEDQRMRHESSVWFSATPQCS